MPYWGGAQERYAVNEQAYDGHLFHIAALLSYVCILIGFRTSYKKPIFRKWNDFFSNANAGKYGLILTAVGVLGYASVRGFHFSFVANSDNTALVMGGFVYYLMMMLDVLPFAAALLIIGIRNNRRDTRKVAIYFFSLWLILVHFLIAGARWRIVVMVIAVLTVYYLYLVKKRVSILWVGTLAFVLYIGFSAMDQVRSRGRGINMEEAQDLSYNDVKGGAGENSSVYSFSLMCIGQINKSEERVYFQPIVTAVLMPIPRFMFPWKPDATYLHKVEEIVLGNADSGAAYLNFVESFFSFGWIGVIFWAWFLGWLARRFWDNYLNNKQSIGAVIALGVFSGLCYVFISRGYLAASLTSFLISLYVPFWVVKLIKKIYEK